MPSALAWFGHLWRDLRRGPYVEPPPEPLRVVRSVSAARVTTTAKPPARPPRNFDYERRQ